MRLHVREWGTGDRTAVLVHGGATDSTTWHRVAPALATRGYRVLAPDLRGHGASPRGYYSPTALAGDLVETVPDTPELVLGHSLGAAVLALAVERLRPTAAVYAEPYWGVTGCPEPLGPAAFARFRELGRDEIAAVVPRWEPADIDVEIAARARWDPRVTAELNRFDMPAMPARAVVPSLVLLAATSPMNVEVTAARSRGFEVRVVPGTGHTMHHDNLDAFLASLPD